MASRYHTKKLFIQRDYSEGTAVRFSKEFPVELRGIVSCCIVSLYQLGKSHRTVLIKAI